MKENQHVKKILLTILLSLSALLSSALAGNWTVYDQYGHYYYGHWQGNSGYLYDHGGNYRYYYGNPGSHYIYDDCGNSYYLYGN